MERKIKRKIVLFVNGSSYMRNGTFPKYEVFDYKLGRFVFNGNIESELRIWLDLNGFGLGKVFWSRKTWGKVKEQGLRDISMGIEVVVKCQQNIIHENERTVVFGRIPR